MIKSYFNDLQRITPWIMWTRTRLWAPGRPEPAEGKKLRRRFFLTNCDILIDADFGDIYQYHKEKGNVITMVCAVKHFTIPYGVVELGGDGDISGITEKPEMNFLTNTGVYVVEPSVIDGLAYNEPLPLQISSRMCARGRARGRVSREREQLDGYGPAGGAGQHAPPFGDAVGRRGITQAAAPGKARTWQRPGGNRADRGEIICQCSSSRRRA